MLANAVGLLIVVLASSSRQLTRTQIILFIVLSVFSVRLYETMLVFSLITLCILFVRSRNGRNVMSNSTRNVIGFVLLCSALSSASGLVAPVSSENLQSGFDLGAIFSHTPTTFFFITVALLSVGMISLLIGSRAFWLTILCIGNVLLLLLFVMVSNQQVGPSAHWYFRSPVTVIVATIAICIASFAAKEAVIIPLNKGSLSYFYTS